MRSGPSLASRDGARLQLGIAQVTDLQLTRTPSLAGAWPLTSGHRLEVNGFVAAQAVVHPVPTRLLAVGSQRNLALDVTLPANGYLSDAIWRLAVSNAGSALPGDDIAAVEAWVDNGDGVFSTVTDTRLGALAYSGAFWQLSGLNTSVPVGGRRAVLLGQHRRDGPPVARHPAGDPRRPGDRPSTWPAATTVRSMPRWKIPPRWASAPPTASS